MIVAFPTSSDPTDGVDIVGFGGISFQPSKNAEASNMVGRPLQRLWLKFFCGTTGTKQGAVVERWSGKVDDTLVSFEAAGSTGTCR